MMIQCTRCGGEVTLYETENQSTRRCVCKTNSQIFIEKLQSDNQQLINALVEWDNIYTQDHASQWEEHTKRLLEEITGKSYRELKEIK